MVVEGEAGIGKSRLLAERISEELAVRWRLPLYQAVLATRCFPAGEWDVAVATALAAWAVIRLVGVDLTLKDGASQVGSQAVDHPQYRG